LRYFWSVNIVTDAIEVAHDDGADAAIGALLQYIHRDGVVQVRPPGGPLSINYFQALSPLPQEATQGAK
jgi:hypothetical protein